MGDLGNVDAINGKIITNFSDSIIQLYGPFSIIGRSVILHEKEDDLGRGRNNQSLINGNAGSRIACGFIGYS